MKNLILTPIKNDYFNINLLCNSFKKHFSVFSNVAKNEIAIIKEIQLFAPKGTQLIKSTTLNTKLNDYTIKDLKLFKNVTLPKNGTIKEIFNLVYGNYCYYKKINTELKKAGKFTLPLSSKLEISTLYGTFTLKLSKDNFWLINDKAAAFMGIDNSNLLPNL